MSETRKIGPGARVRYLYGIRSTGTVLRRYAGKDDMWLVKWDDPREVRPHNPSDAHESNLELLEEESRP